MRPSPPLSSFAPWPGHHQRLSGQISCEECVPGEHQPEPGEASCVACQTGRDSLAGSSQCNFCAEGYYRQNTMSPASSCEGCGAIQGVVCGTDAVITTFLLTAGHWRHANTSMEIWRCKFASGGWSPCYGGDDAGFEGNGYCAPGYRGPRCEVCDSPDDNSEYFDELDAKCHNCGDVTTNASALFATLFIILLAAMGGTASVTRVRGCTRHCNSLRRGIRWTQKVWWRAGMRYKVKAMVGLYQCLSAVPSVFDVTTPTGLEAYTR